MKTFKFICEDCEKEFYKSESITGETCNECESERFNPYTLGETYLLDGEDNAYVTLVKINGNSAIIKYVGTKVEFKSDLSRLKFVN